EDEEENITNPPEDEEENITNPSEDKNEDIINPPVGEEESVVPPIETEIPPVVELEESTFISSTGEIENPDNLLQNGTFGEIEASNDWVKGVKPVGWNAVKRDGSPKMPEFEVIQNEINNNLVKINIKEEKLRATIKHAAIEALPNTEYELTIDANVLLKAGADNKISGNFGVQIIEYKNDGSKVTYTSKDVFPNFQVQNTNGWKTISQKFVTSKDAIKLEVQLLIGATNVVSGGTIELDNVVLTENIAVAVTGVAVNNTQIKDEVGTEHYLTSSIVPENATNKRVTWTSMNPEVATVDDKGKVTLVSRGSTDIVVTTEDGEFSAVCKVISEGEMNSDNLLKNPDFSKVESGADTEIWAEGIKPSQWNASKWGTYTPPKMTIADIDDRENVLSMEVTDSNTRITVLQSVNVEPSTNYKLSFDANIEGVVGNDFGIQIKQFDNQNKEIASVRKTICKTKDTKGWQVLEDVIYTEPNAARIDVVIMAGAAAHLTAGTMLVDNFNLESIIVDVEGIVLDKSSIYDKVGTTHRLIAQVKPSTASNQEVIWTSSDDNVVTVDGDGNLNMLKPGKATITVRTVDGDHTATCEVTVVDNIVIDSISMEKDATLELGSSLKLIPVLEPVGVPLEAVKWYSSNEDIATVDESGNVTPLMPGQVVITASNQEETVKAECVITVIDKIHNYVPNGGFEEIDEKNSKLPKGYAYWTPEGSVKAGLDTDSYRGQYSFKIVAEESSRTSVNTANIELKPGTYRISLWTKMKDVSASQGVRFRYNILKEDGSKLTNYSTGKKVAEDWEQISLIVEAPQGTKSIDIQTFFETGTGTAWIDEIKIEEWKLLQNVDLEDEITIDLSSVEDSSGAINLDKLSYTLNPTFTPADVSDKQLVWLTSNDQVATVKDGVVTGKRAGIATITAMTPDGKIKATSKVTVAGVLPEQLVKPVEKITFINEEEIVQQGTSLKLSPKITPEDATYQDIIWSISDKDIADVIDGRVIAKEVGTVVLTASIPDGKVSGSCKVVVTPNEMNEFDALRLKWKERQVGKDLNQEDLDIQNLIKAKEKTALKYWEDMDKNTSRIYLWEDATNYSKSGDIKESIRRLREMASAATLEGSSLYGNIELINDVVEGTMWIYNNAYSEDHLTKYDWWDWEIGIPGSLNDIFVLVYEYFTQDEIYEVMSFVQDIIMPDPWYSGNAQQDWRVATGANLIDQIKVALVPAVLLEDGQKITKSASYLGSTLEYVTSEDGFYKDGSFVQHTDVPYTGTYGAVLLDGVAIIMDFLAGTNYDISEDPSIGNIYEIIEQSFIPVIYKGGIMDMVRGRAVGRANSDMMSNGRGLITSIVKIAQGAPEPYRSEVLSICKYWIQEARALYSYPPIGNPYAIEMTNKLLDDTSIEAMPLENFSKEFPMMNRTAHHADNFTAGISKSSKRIQTYELTNGENQKGWHTGDGMLYLYNNDLGQFDDYFWVTVDHKRMPGTTIDTKPRAWGDRQNGDGETNPKNAWAGGTSLDEYGVSGMNVNLVGSGLTANKSWFLFDDEIVAVGSAINSNNGYSAETVVEQRKINGDNLFTVNGEIKSEQLGWSESLQDVNWMHLAGNVEGSDIGYYFPEAVKVEAKREKQVGSFHEISLNNDHTSHTRNFMTMTIDHGVNPQNESYVYALLPGKSAEEVADYTKTADFKVVANTNELHAVRENRLGMFGINTFADEEVTAEYVTVNKPSSMMIKEGYDYLEIAISDPTFDNKETIEVIIDKEIKSIISKDDRIEVEILPESTKLIIDVKGSNGKSFVTKLAIEPSSPEKPEVKGCYEVSYQDRQGNKLVADEVKLDLKLGTYTVKAREIAGYKVSGETVKVVELTEAMPTQQVVFIYDKQTTSSGSDDTSDDTTNKDENNKEEVKEEVSEQIIINIDKDKLDLPTVKDGESSQIKDITSHWANESIVKVVERGLMKGKTNESFAPNDTLTRAEIAVILERMLDTKNIKQTSAFKDIKGNEWYAEAVLKMNAIGLINGYENEKFAPKENVKRVEVISLIARLLEYIGADISVENPEEILAQYGDVDQIPNWAKKQIAWCVQTGIVSGNEKGNLSPNEAMTRAEMAVVLSKVLDIIE
ncbi:MAG: polysaccharide lyase family 8 super-sandwich domain-containing protein, partial [Cellulosilyticaceae bacterium]